jgi:hypothetical protein
MLTVRAPWIAKVVVALGLVAGCGEARPPQPSPSPFVAEPALPAGVSQAQLDAWIEFRGTYGLRTDLAWVLDVANSPEAMDTFGVPMLLFEEAIVNQAQMGASDLVSAARGYSNRFPEDQAGVWIEGPLVVIAFSDNIAAHRADVAAQFGAKAIVREVRYSSRDLQAFMRTVVAEKAWLTSVVDVVQVDFEEHLNAVEISYRADGRAVEAAIRAHFKDPDWLFFRHLGTLPWAGPWGDLELKVVDEAGQPMAVKIVLHPLDPRAHAFGPADLDDGTFANKGVAAGDWTVDVIYVVDGEKRTITEAFTVPAGNVARVKVVIDDG